MSDDLTPHGAMLRERLHQAAVTIDPGRAPIDVLRRRYVQRRRRARAELAGGALAAAAAASLLVGNLTQWPHSTTGPATPVTVSAASGMGHASTDLTVHVGGHPFPLPRGFQVTSGPTITQLGPGPSDPLQDSGTSDVLVGEELSGDDRGRQITITVYRGDVGKAMNGRAATDLFGSTASRHVVVSGRSGLVATVGQISVGADGRAEFKMPLTRKGEIPRGAVCTTRGKPLSLICKLTPEQAAGLRLVSPQPGVDVELEVGPDEHLSVQSSGIAEAEVLELVTRALES